jgi:hypothetical protein
MAVVGGINGSFDLPLIRIIERGFISLNLFAVFSCPKMDGLGLGSINHGCNGSTNAGPAPHQPRPVRVVGRGMGRVPR